MYLVFCELKILSADLPLVSVTTYMRVITKNDVKSEFTCHIVWSHVSHRTESRVQYPDHKIK